VLTDEETRAFQDLIARRCERRPTAYLTGTREFYGIELYVAPGVLIPRPETELLVEESLRFLRLRASENEPPVFVDVGTGSGAVVLAVAKNWSRARYLAIDNSQAALEIATLNAKRPKLAGRIEFLRGDLVESLPVNADVMAANLPYVRSSDLETLPPEIARYEPRQALDGGEDGLAVIRRLIGLAPSRLSERGVLLLEIGDGQYDAVADLLRDALPASTCYGLADLSGIVRVVVADRARAEVPERAVVR
jgi:release factor glutamine methyltransferase